MKIGLVHLNLAVESGDPRMFFSLARALERLGHTVVLYTAQFDPQCFPELNRGLEIHAVGKVVPYTISKTTTFIAKVFDRIRRRKAALRAVDKIFRALDHHLELLVLQNDESYRLGLRYKKINPAVRVAWVMNNAPFYHAPKEKLLTNIASFLLAKREEMNVRRFIRGIDLVVVHDRKNQKLITPFGARVALLNIPVNFESFYTAPRARKLKDKRVTLLGIGSLSPVRKFEDIILAGEELVRRGYDAKIILVCKDFWGDIKYKSMLLQMTDESSMARRVDFRFEGVSEEELRAIQRKSDVFVFPNVVNIWGMAAFEAMAAGLPLVVSSVTSVAEVLQDSKEALFTKPADPKDIAVKVMALISDPARYAAVAKAGQEFVRKNLSWERYAEALLSFASRRT